jgi:hypothetical protein
MSVPMAGFQTAKFTKLELRVDTQARRDVQLSVGMAEAVTVEGESPLINTNGRQPRQHDHRAVDPGAAVEAATSCTC